MIYWNTKHRLSLPTVYQKHLSFVKKGFMSIKLYWKHLSRNYLRSCGCVCTCLHMWGSWCSYFNGEERLNTSTPPPHLTVLSELQQLLGPSCWSCWASPHWNAICSYEFCTLWSALSNSKCTYSLSIFSSRTNGSNWPRLPLEYTK